MEMDDECLLLNDKTACIEGFKKNLVDSLISKQNINLLNDEIFQENVKRFSRYNIERQWPIMVKTDENFKRLNAKTEIELSYWKYPCRQMHRAVSEPNLQAIHMLGTKILQKSNSFHDLSNFTQQFMPAVNLFKTKLITWLYVTKSQCHYINFIESDKDLVKVIGGIFEWKTANEKNIMTRLFVDLTKYCKKYEFTNEKISTLLGIYCHTHLYNKSLDILSYEKVYGFFKDLIIHHSVLEPPTHVKIYSTEEAKRLITQFLNKYLTCLPLIRHICVPNSVLPVQ